MDVDLIGGGRRPTPSRLQASTYASRDEWIEAQRKRAADRITQFQSTVAQKYVMTRRATALAIGQRS
jgi:hypothetical protein